MKPLREGVAKVSGQINVNVLAAIVMLGVSAWLVVTSVMNARPAPSVPAYVAGDSLDDIPGLVLGPTRTLILWIQSSCPYCTKSMPFYKRIAEAENRSDRIVALGAETPQVIADYLRQHGVRVDQVLSTQGANVRFAGTPTLALVSPARKILSVWRGQLVTVAKEAEVLTALRLR